MSFLDVLTNEFVLPEIYQCPDNTTKFGERWPRFGVYLFSSGSVMLFLYVLCFLAISNVKHFTPSYKLMFLISILDMTQLTIGSIIVAYLTYNGYSFCFAPKFFFFIGSTAMGSWLTGCVSCILLAIERCTEESLYVNGWLANNNIVMAIATLALNFYLCYYLIFKYGYSTSMWLYKTKRQIIMQGIILCAFHAAAATTYNFLQYITPPLWLVVQGEVLWQLSCGCLSVAYLIFNRTIRNSVLKMVIPKKIRAYFGLHIGVEEHLEIERAAEASGGGAVAVKFNNFVAN